MRQVTRREFLHRSGASLAGVAAMTAASAENVRGANERVNIAMVGCGGRGRYVTRGLIQAGANLTWLCDLHAGRIDQSWRFLSEVQKTKPAFTADMRRVFDAKDVDAVVVSTPDHWHGPTTILACQAGKDVYVEKPHSHNIWESRTMVATARKHKSIVQVGTQNRSGAYTRAAREYVKSGKLGKIPLVKVYNMKPGGPFKLGNAGTCPPGFDWDKWLGRASKRPYHQRVFAGGWHHFWDFSGGDMADDGIHQIDLAMMLMGDPPAPTSVRSIGGRYAHRGDDSQTPDLQVVNWDFGKFIMTFELTGYPRYMRKTTATIRRKNLMPYWTQNATRIELYGSDLLMTVGRHGGGWIVQQSTGRIVDKMFGRIPEEPHFRNFLACVKSRKAPNANVAKAHASNVAMHMGNIAHRVGNVSLKYDAKTGTFDNDKANQLIKPDYRNGYEIPNV